MKLVLVWFKESLFALNQEDTRSSSEFRVLISELRSGLVYNIVVSSANKVKVKREEE